MARAIRCVSAQDDNPLEKIGKIPTALHLALYTAGFSGFLAQKVSLGPSGFYHSVAVPSLKLIVAIERLLRLPLGLLIGRTHDY